MRKLFLAGVSVFALGASGAMAESATTNQHGTGGGAYINQADDTTDATATITQGIDGTPGNSANDVASIHQSGEGDVDATVNQNTIGSGGSNLAGIVQSDGLDTSVAGTRGNDNPRWLIEQGRRAPTGCWQHG